jgi:hypothetical protein
MPLLKIDLPDMVQADRKGTTVGRYWWPAGGSQLAEVEKRWCNQCRLQETCGIIARARMLYELGRLFEAWETANIEGDLSAIAPEWRVQSNGKARCEAMQFKGDE